jgi:hypothetical protein
MSWLAVAPITAGIDAASLKSFGQNQQHPNLPWCAAFSICINGLLGMIPLAATVC